MQLAATRGGKWEWLFGLFASVPASGASRIHKSRLQPCEPKPRTAEARKARPAGFGPKTTQRRPKQSLRTYNLRSFWTERTQPAEHARRKPKRRASAP